MAIPDPHYTELLYRALAAPIGIAVRCSDIERGKQALYQCRKLLCDEQLARLSFRINPLAPQSEIFILKAYKAPQAESSEG